MKHPTVYPDKLKTAVTGHMYIGETTEKAKEEFYPLSLLFKLLELCE